MNLDKRRKEMRNFFNEKIDTYDDVHINNYMDIKENMIENLNGDIKVALDLGAGTGLELIPFFKKYPNSFVTAVDTSEKMLEELSKRPFAKRVERICGDFLEIDYHEEFDAVISTSALHHFDEETKGDLYKKIYNALNNNGVFVNSDKYVKTLEEQNDTLNEYINNPTLYKHMDTPLTKENEVKLLKKAGFKEINVLNTRRDDYILIIAKKN